MKTSLGQIVFAGIKDVVYREQPAEITPPRDGVVIETRYTCISAGTELAKLVGLQKVEFPLCLGNRAVGRVVEVGDACKTLRVGDLVFTHTRHESRAAGFGAVAKLPDALDRPATAMMGMAMVAMTGLRVARPELGDTAVVTGAGLVGQFAAQLLELSGVRAIVIDPVQGRLDVARQCGIAHTINPTKEDARERVMDLTGGKGVDTILECAGHAAVAEAALACAGRSAEVVLVGSPRAEHRTNLTDFLQAFHLWRPHGDLVLKGAHEWKIPPHATHGVKHTLDRNAVVLGDLMASGRLKLDPLLSAVHRPAECAEAYQRLQDNPDEMLGVVFDWTKETDG